MAEGAGPHRGGLYAIINRVEHVVLSLYTGDIQARGGGLAKAAPLLREGQAVVVRVDCLRLAM
jgi:hypothetical protein